MATWWPAPGNRERPGLVPGGVNTAAGVLAWAGGAAAPHGRAAYLPPDIGEFIEVKQAGGLEYFNLSVTVTSRFMRP
jgi:hypothetical protein